MMSLFCYISHTLVSERILRWLYLRLDQKVFITVGEYDDVIKGPLFQSCLGPPSLIPTTMYLLLLTQSLERL